MSLKKVSATSSVYDKYPKHQGTGKVILGPPASGKTTFVNNQIDWIDQDVLFSELGLDWHHKEDDPIHFKSNYLRADYMSEQSKVRGCWIIGSLFWEYKADAIVIPELELHKKYISNRDDLVEDSVMKIREILVKHAILYNTPIFSSCEEAATFLQ